jgi:hypothetical protein
MSLKKTIAILISVIFISSPVIANAQTTTSTSAKFTFLNEGDAAPFTGTLFSIEATAKLLAEKARAEQECKLKVKYETDTLQAKCTRDNDLLSSELKIEKKKYNIIVAAQDEEIGRLQKIATKSNDYDILWFGGGIAIGMITSIAIFFAASEIVKK